MLSVHNTGRLYSIIRRSGDGCGNFSGCRWRCGRTAVVVALAALVWGLGACATNTKQLRQQDLLQQQMEYERQLQELEQRYVEFEQGLKELRNRQEKLSIDLARAHLTTEQMERSLERQTLIQDDLETLWDQQQTLVDLLTAVRSESEALRRRNAASKLSDSELESAYREQQIVGNALARVREQLRHQREIVNRIRKQQTTITQKLKEISDARRRLADLRGIQDKLEDRWTQYRQQQSIFNTDLLEAENVQKSSHTALLRVCPAAKTQLTQELTSLQRDLDSLSLKLDSLRLRDAKASLDHAQEILSGHGAEQHIVKIEAHQRLVTAGLDRANEYYVGLNAQLRPLLERQIQLQRELANHWLCLKDPDTQKWVKVIKDYNTSFEGKYLEFEYLIERERVKDREQPGAILVRVVRVYDPNWGKRSDLRNQTNLFRNKFPEKKGLSDGEVQRDLYEKYHRCQIENLTLRHDFHAKTSPNVHTNKPCHKRIPFLFDAFYNEQTAHRAYLLYYKGIRPSGSRIRFDVGVSGAFKKVAVTVLELNPPSGIKTAPRRVVITKE